MPPLSWLTWLSAVLPVVVLLVLMVRFRWSGGKAGAVAWFVALLVARFLYGMDWPFAALASLKGLWSTVFVLYIIWGAMAMYYLVHLTGATEMMTATFSRLTAGNRLLQLLVLGWVFSSFLQGVLGFGMPVAIVGPLLMNLGFPAPLAVATVLIGHSWAVTFGSLGASFSMLQRLSALPTAQLGFYAGIFIGLCAYLVGFSICHLYGGWKGVREGLGAVLVIATSLALVANVMANTVPQVGSFVAGLVTLGLLGVLLTRTTWQKRTAVPTSAVAAEGASAPVGGGRRMGFHLAFAPYYALIAVVLGVYLTPLKDLLGSYTVGIPFPRAATAFGAVSEATAAYAPIKVLTAPGTMIFVSVLLGYLIYSLAGVWRRGAGRTLAAGVVAHAVPATVTLLTMSMMAAVMTDSGMLRLLATGLARVTGRAYALVAPLVGVLGAFMTGSNTNSNLLFTGFQVEIARLLGLSTVIVCAMQTAGGTIGTMLCPMNVALGTSTCGIIGQEGRIIRRTLVYGVVQALTIGLVGYALIALAG